MTPETLRSLAASVAWQDRTDVRDGMLAAADELERLSADLACYPPLKEYEVESGDLCKRVRTYSPEEAMNIAMREGIGNALANCPDENPASGLCETTEVGAEGEKPTHFNTGLVLLGLKLWHGKPEGWYA